MRASEIEALVRRGEVFSELDLSGLEGRGIELGGGVFDHVSFKGADLTGASLREATFHKCDFSGVKLAGSNLHLVAFVETSLARREPGPLQHSPPRRASWT
ncbi:MAG: pentapeptide repeat-containing protein [Polyangiaceae bacterium]